MRFNHRIMKANQHQVATQDTTHDTLATTLAVSDLSQDDIDNLIYLYQEEKLAMDVYDALAEQYPDTIIFDKISDAELTHMTTVENILLANDIDITDLQSLEAGEFINEDLQTLYTDLVEQGSTSLEDALNVGISIENLDIADLNEFTDAEDANVDLVGVLSHLETGSEHHLSAFTNVLDNTIA